MIRTARLWLLFVTSLAAVFGLCNPVPADSTKAPVFTFKTYEVPHQLQTWLTGINNAGVIVGWYADQQGNSHGIILKNGKFKQIDDPSGSQTEIWGINDRGDVVGFYQDNCVEEVCLEGFLYRDGTFTDIGPPWFTTPPEDDAPDSQAFGIDKSGVIAGNAGDGFGSSVGFLKIGGHYHKLKVPGANGEQAVAINDSGLVTLDWATDTSFNVSLYDGKTYTNIDVPNAANSYQGGLNSRGDVVLAFDAGNGKPIHGALLRSGSYYTFDDPNTRQETIPIGLNDNHTIVGVWSRGRYNIHVHGFIATYK